MHQNASTASREAVPFVDLKRQTSGLESELMPAIGRVLGRCDFILGEETAKFEAAFASYLDAPHAIGVASGLDALRLSLLAVGVGPGCEVLLPANTFIATALAVSSVGARPVLVDCDSHTYNLDCSQVKAAITPRTRAILPVHLAGLAANMDEVLAIAEQHGLAVVEDACQAHGAVYAGRRCGTLGVTGCFSFYPGKNLGAFGDGGAIVTGDAAIAERLRRLRNYGQEVKYRHVEQGLNSRLDTLQAAVLNVKLGHLDRWNAARAGHAAEYRRLLAGTGDLKFQHPGQPGEHVYHLFIIETERRDELQAFLAERGVQTGIHYPLPIHLQPAYAELGYAPGDFPVAERLAARMLSLPMFPELANDQLHHVVESVQAFFDTKG